MTSSFIIIVYRLVLIRYIKYNSLCSKLFNLLSKRLQVIIHPVCIYYTWIKMLTFISKIVKNILKGGCNIYITPENESYPARSAVFVYIDDLITIWGINFTYPKSKSPPRDIESVVRRGYLNGEGLTTTREIEPRHKEGKTLPWYERQENWPKLIETIFPLRCSFISS